jgi:hypothetical protein
MQTKLAYFNVLMVKDPLGAPEVLERHVVPAADGVAATAKKLLGGWVQKGDKVALLEAAPSRRRGLTVTPAVIYAPDGEHIDIFGQWVEEA